MVVVLSKTIIDQVNKKKTILRVGRHLQVDSVYLKVDSRVRFKFAAFGYRFEKLVTTVLTATKYIGLFDNLYFFFLAAFV